MTASGSREKATAPALFPESGNVVAARTAPGVLFSPGLCPAIAAAAFLPSMLLAQSSHLSPADATDDDVSVFRATEQREIPAKASRHAALPGIVGLAFGVGRDRHAGGQHVPPRTAGRHLYVDGRSSRPATAACEVLSDSWSGESSR